ncbi:lipopolysaccharide heptosyltransferase II [Noviherbaspirillum sp. Root189]|uniref:lipopolysaccharide heptosyltransferase II n=1 Tax=Noviherbaspirillum sp. Root189 TaxID=1736487 RepID=UPI000A5D2A5A|nr:lipopolysaccharide heptosyltransferase II [Noviherbaspirillum sp. Root189]
MSMKPWHDVRRILCIRLDYLGDVLMSTPAIRALKQSHPGSHITLLTSSSGAVAARHVPEIDDVIDYAAPWMKSSSPHEPACDHAMIDRLSEAGFDAAVIFTVYSQNPLPAAMLCYLAGIPLRLAHCHENPYQMLTHWVRDPEPEERIRHEVRRQLDLVATIGAHTDDERMSFNVPCDDMRAARNLLSAIGVDSEQPWIVLHPGATAQSRRYPPEYWREASRTLASKLGCPLVFTGGKDETELVEQIRADIPNAFSLAGKLTLGELAAVITLSPLLISNNTGPAHIAAAVGTPVVDLYALTNPQHTPWQVNSRVLFQDVSCRFCYKSVCPQGHHRCLTGVAPQQVVDAAVELLQLPSAAQPTVSSETFTFLQIV